jgi:hypothetical protein
MAAPAYDGDMTHHMDTEDTTMSTLYGRRMMVSLLSLIALLILTACGSTSRSTPPTSQLTETEATAIAENALRAINSGDFAAYSHDWSAAMKAGISENAFQSWRQQVLGSAGSFQHIEKAELVAGRTPGIVRWRFTCDFEKARIQYDLSFKQEGEQIEGVFFEPIT